MIIQHKLLWTLCAVVSAVVAIPLQNSAFHSTNSQKSNSDFTALPYIQSTSRLINESEISAKIGYPEMAFDAGIQGEVTFLILTNGEGEYISHELVESFHPLLRIPCEKNLSEITFQPSHMASNGESYSNKVTFVFSLPKYAK